MKIDLSNPVEDALADIAAKNPMQCLYGMGFNGSLPLTSQDTDETVLYPLPIKYEFGTASCTDLPLDSGNDSETEQAYTRTYNDTIVRHYDKYDNEFHKNKLELSIEETNSLEDTISNLENDFKDNADNYSHSRYTWEELLAAAKDLGLSKDNHLLEPITVNGPASYHYEREYYKNILVAYLDFIKLRNKIDDCGGSFG